MKIKKLFCLLTTAVITVSAFASNTFAYYDKSIYGTKIGSFTYVLKKDVLYGSVYFPTSATVIDIPNVKKVKIPEKVTYNGTEFTVTEIDLCNFGEIYSKVEEIVLPETIYNIRDFYGFSKLKKMNLPKNAMLGRWCDDDVYSDRADFDDIVHLSYLKQCPNLKLTVDPNNQHYSYKNDFLLTKDGKEIIMSFNHSTNLIIPDGIEKIVDYGGIGFKHVKSVKFPDTLKHLYGTWSSLENIKLPNQLTILGGSFSKLKLTKVVIPDSVKTTYSGVFSGSNIKSVKIGKGLTMISNEMFSNCKNLKSIVIPTNINEIDCDAFKNCKNLKKVNIRSNNVDIRYDAFRNCKNLKSITINGVKKIFERAFCNCKNLKIVSINKVDKIDADAFYNCKKLSKIIIKNKKKAPKIVSEFDGNFKNTKKGIKFVVKNKKVAKQLKKQLSKKKFKKYLKDAKIIVGKKVIYKINSK